MSWSRRPFWFLSAPAAVSTTVRVFFIESADRSFAVMLPFGTAAQDCAASSPFDFFADFTYSPLLSV